VVRPITYWWRRGLDIMLGGDMILRHDAPLGAAALKRGAECVVADWNALPDADQRSVLSEAHGANWEPQTAFAVRLWFLRGLTLILFGDHLRRLFPSSGATLMRWGADLFVAAWKALSGDERSRLGMGVAETPGVRLLKRTSRVVDTHELSVTAAPGLVAESQRVETPTPAVEASSAEWTSSLAATAGRAERAPALAAAAPCPESTPSMAVEAPSLDQGVPVLSVETAGVDEGAPLPAIEPPRLDESEAVVAVDGKCIDNTAPVLAVDAPRTEDPRASAVDAPCINKCAPVRLVEAARAADARPRSEETPEQAVDAPGAERRAELAVEIMGEDARQWNDSLPAPDASCVPLALCPRRCRERTPAAATEGLPPSRASGIRCRVRAAEPLPGLYRRRMLARPSRLGALLGLILVVAAAFAALCGSWWGNGITVAGGTGGNGTGGAGTSNHDAPVAASVTRGVITGSGGSHCAAFHVQPSGPQTITVRFDPTSSCAAASPAWGVHKGNVGTIPTAAAASAVFTLTGTTGGVATFSASLHKQTVTRQVLVKLTATQNGPNTSPGEVAQIPASAGALTAGGGVGGVGGESLGTAVMDPGTRTALGAPTGNSTAQGLTFLHPYDRTVWPRGMLTPLPMWTWAGHADAILIHLNTTTGSFVYTGTFGCPAILASNGKFTRVPIPQAPAPPERAPCVNAAAPALSAVAVVCSKAAPPPSPPALGCGGDDSDHRLAALLGALKPYLRPPAVALPAAEVRKTESLAGKPFEESQRGDRQHPPRRNVPVHEATSAAEVSFAHAPASPAALLVAGEGPVAPPVLVSVPLAAPSATAEPPAPSPFAMTPEPRSAEQPPQVVPAPLSEVTDARPPRAPASTAVARPALVKALPFAEAPASPNATVAPLVAASEPPEVRSLVADVSADDRSLAVGRMKTMPHADHRWRRPTEFFPPSAAQRSPARTTTRAIWRVVSAEPSPSRRRWRRPCEPLDPHALCLADGEATARPLTPAGTGPRRSRRKRDPPSPAVMLGVASRGPRPLRSLCSARARGRAPELGAATSSASHRPLGGPSCWSSSSSSRSPRPHPTHAER